MFKFILFVLFFSKFFFINANTDLVILPIIVTGRVISEKEEVLKEIEKNLYQIDLTNSFNEDIFIFGKSKKKFFLYKIKKNNRRIFKIISEEKFDLYYILNNKTYKFKTYEEFLKKN